MTLNPGEKDPEEEDTDSSDAEGEGEGEEKEGEEDPKMETTAPQPAAAAGAKEELKLVVHIIGTSASIGVQKKGSDPIFSTAAGTREEIMMAALKALVEAEEKWKAALKNPKANVPQPTPTQATTKAATGSTQTKAAPPKAQPGFF